MSQWQILLIAALFLAVCSSFESIEAEKAVWNYTTEGDAASVDISADGEYIVTGTYDDKIHLFHKDSSTPLWSYTAGETVSTVAISADGEYIAASSREDFYLFGKGSSTPLWNYTTKGNVDSVAITDDGEYIVSGTIHGHIDFFHKDNSTPLWSYYTKGGVYSIGISSDGEYVVAGCLDSPYQNASVYLISGDSGTLHWSYDIGSNVHAVDISADGEYIVSGSNDGTIRLFNKDSSTPIWGYEGDGYYVQEVTISADGEYIAAGSDGHLYFFNRDSGTPLWSYYNSWWSWNSVGISADGEYIAAGSDDGNIYVFGKGNGESIWNYAIGENVESVAISADGEHISAGTNNHKVYYFDNTAGETDLEIKDANLYFNRYSSCLRTDGDSDGVTIYAKVRNNGGAATGIEVKFYIDGAQFGPIQTISSLGFGEEVLITIDWVPARGTTDWNSGIPIKVVVDPNDMIAETDSSNNEAELSYTVIEYQATKGLEEGQVIGYDLSLARADSTVVTGSWIASMDGTGVWTVQIVKFEPQVSVDAVHWYLIDQDGWTQSDGLVSEIYGYYPDMGEAVIFIDNDFNCMLSPGDKFEIHPGNRNQHDGSDLAYIYDVTDFSMRIKTVAVTLPEEDKTDNKEDKTDDEGTGDGNDDGPEEDDLEEPIEIPSISLITALISIGLIAILRRRN